MTNAAAARRCWEELVAEADSCALCEWLHNQLRDARLTFGGRVLCSVLRPFFVDTADESRIAAAAETLALLGERVANAALSWPELLDELGPTPEELRLASIDPGYQTISTASRADAFLLPDELQFAEYNAESPGGPGYSHRLADVFASTPIMTRFQDSFRVRRHRTIERLLEALLETYREWGGRARPPQMAIVDWREVPTWSEFELLRDAFVAAGVPTVVCDPRDLIFEQGRLRAQDAVVDLVYRRVLVSDIVARGDECRALVDAYAAHAVCVANALRCKLPQKKTFFAVLTDERFSRLFESDAEQQMVRRHVPWTRRLRAGWTTRDGERIDLLEYARAQRERLVLKPSDEYGGAGVQLGWELRSTDWEDALAAALKDVGQVWILQERIKVLRELFPTCDGTQVTHRDMLVDLAPYLFRGRLSGYLTRLSATGLANVTSGGGQVASFIVEGAR
jgi:uncharacterized circularly permuted ATP-grasp superfamily protein